MRGFSAVLLLFLLGTSSSGWADERAAVSSIQSFLETDSLNSSSKAFTSFLTQLQDKRRQFDSDHDFVRFIFRKTHQKFLKRYETYATFGMLFNRGNYNCLTGTALYAVILDHFQIQHTIIETNYHIFILAQTQEGRILLEATDPMNGYVDNEQNIEEKLAVYRKNSIQEKAPDHGTQYAFTFNLWEVVSIQEIKGLLYFNQAVKTYNENQYAKSIQYLEMASTHHPSKRIQEFTAVVMLAVANSEISLEAKEPLIRQLRNIRRQSSQFITASLK